jgi:zinc transport system substrate-binding protein
MKRIFWLVATLTMFALPTMAAPKVVSSIQPVNMLVGAVMKGIAVPQTLLPPGASPHSYALRPSEARRLAEADVIFWIGPEMERFLERPLDTLARASRKVALLETPGLRRLGVRDAAAFDEHDDDDHEEHEEDEHEEDEHDDHAHKHGGIDPHIWLDPTNAQAMVRYIVEVLVDTDPINAGTYRRNAVEAQAIIDAARDDAAARLIPYRSLRFITYHDAFQYFEIAFGLESAGVLAINPDVPPSVAGISALRDHVTEKNVSCAFFEPQFDGRAIHALTRDLGLGFSVLDPMGPVGIPDAAQYRLMLVEMAEGFSLCTE